MVFRSHLSGQPLDREPLALLNVRVHALRIDSVFRFLFRHSGHRALMRCNGDGAALVFRTLQFDENVFSMYCSPCTLAGVFEDGL